MKKYIVLSVNDNPEYLFYLPLTVWAWRKFGWEPIIFRPQKSNTEGIFKFVTESIQDSPCMLRYIHDNIPYSSEMVAQISRLYAACLGEIGYFMTGDIDMIPLSDYWHFDENDITTWGRDLTDGHYPICYIGMDNAKWQQVMGITSNLYSEMIKRDLDSMPNSKSEDPIKRWIVDQDLITERIEQTLYPVRRIDRGTYANGYPIGRVDRSAWTLNHDKFIDAHLHRGIWSTDWRYIQTIDLLRKIWPDENFMWFENYTERFKTLMKIVYG